MENKTVITVTIIALISVLFLVGATITGSIVQKIDYQDLCSTDADCPVNQCCLMHKGVGLCMQHCQSIDFLCKEDAECEDGTVCCISEGMEYGLCNSADKCVSMDLFAEYVEKSSTAERPASADINQVLVIVESLIILVLLGVIIWLTLRHKGKK